MFHTEFAGKTGQPLNDGEVTCACTKGAAHSRQGMINLFKSMRVYHLVKLMQEKNVRINLAYALQRRTLVLLPCRGTSMLHARKEKGGAGALVWGNWVRRPLLRGLIIKTFAPLIGLPAKPIFR